MLAVEQVGSGVPLVFLHAFPFSRLMWGSHKPVFSKNFRFITVDFPGFGESAPMGETVTMEQMATQVVETLDSLNLQGKIVLAGLSMGGYVALPLINLIPERIRAIAFISTRSGPDSPEGREKRFKNIELIQKEGINLFAERMTTGLLGKSTQVNQPQIVHQVRSWIEKASPNAVCAALRGMASRPDTTAILKTLRIPCLFLSGAEDSIIPSAEMEEMSKKVAKSEFHVLPQAGHLLNLEQPVLFQDLFLHFLKRHVL